MLNVDTDLRISPAVALRMEQTTWYVAAVRSTDAAEGHTGGDHLVLVHHRDADPEPGELPVLPAVDVPVRVHSECLFGDVFGGHRCDCGQQLRTAREDIVDAGFGVLVYLRQEGRGIGLYDKIRSFLMPGDTFERNLLIGRPADGRGYGLVVDILRELGIESVRLLSGNPHKAQALSNSGLEVTLCGSYAEDVTEEATRELAAKIRNGYVYQRAA